MGQGKLASVDVSSGWSNRLREVSERTHDDKNSWRPIIVTMGDEKSEKELDDLLQDTPILKVLDSYDEQYSDLIVSRSPKLYKMPYEDKVMVLKEELKAHHAFVSPWKKGSWVYYPWSGTLAHVIERELFLELRSTRNRNLITAEEQKTIGDFNVGCVGMSAGSSVALSTAISGCSLKLKIADGAVISGSNLNRILAGVSDIGLSKSLVVARKIYEMNPYVNIERFDGNITSDNIADFFDKPWSVDAVVDEVDDLMLKIQLRIEARKRHIPVVMATDIGDDIMLDVERFDLEPDRPLFHGLIDGIDDPSSLGTGKVDFLKVVNAIIGPKNASIRVLESFMQVGRELAVLPQLGSSTIMAGNVVSYALRKIALGEDLKSGRTIISVDKHFFTELSTDEYKMRRLEMIEVIEKGYRLK